MTPGPTPETADGMTMEYGFEADSVLYVNHQEYFSPFAKLTRDLPRGKIDFTCENSYDDAEAAPGGIGLANAERRLELLYKDRYQLQIDKAENTYHVHLTLMP